MTKQQYEKMCAKFEGMNMYDGRGTTDVYECEKCKRSILSTYIDKGVTPFTIQCRCGGMMEHTKTYKGVYPYVNIKWIRPTYEQFLVLSPSMQEHVKNGGLVKKSDLT